MKLKDKILPLAAAVTALSSLACCLPLGIAAAAGAGGLAIILEPIRPWLLALSAIFLAIGFLQLYRHGKMCQRRSRTTVALFWIAAVIVVAMIVFPQSVAAILAGGMP